MWRKRFTLLYWGVSIASLFFGFIVSGFGYALDRNGQFDDDVLARDMIGLGEPFFIWGFALILIGLIYLCRQELTDEIRKLIV